MKLEDFNNLSDEEKSAFLDGASASNRQIEDLTAERDSFKSENATLKQQAAADSKELKATKEMNFTLARRLNVTEETKDDETLLYEFIQNFHKRN